MVVDENVLPNFADYDILEGYNVEKISNKTYTYQAQDGLIRTVSVGRLVKK